MQTKLKVFIADDSFLIRERLAGVLGGLKEIELVGQAEDARQALDAIRRLQPDAVVLDIHMPSADGYSSVEVQNGIDVLEAIKKSSPSPFVIILSNYNYSQYQKKCMEAGANAFLHKTREFDQVADLLVLQAAEQKATAYQILNGTAADTNEAPAIAAEDAPKFKKLPGEIKAILRVPYALRRIPTDDFATLLPVPAQVSAGDVLMVRLEQMGRNTRFELAAGRLCNLHEGDVLAVVAGNRYATEQFEGYAEIDGVFCDLLSMGGLCGKVKSKRSGIPDPTKLRVLGALGNSDGHALCLRNYGLPEVPELPTARRPRTIVVCGTSMDSGKTYTAFSLIFGLHSHGHKVGAYKLTGTAAGRDTWSMLDAGAYPALDFVDGGHGSTYLCDLEELLRLHNLLSTHAAEAGADWIVIEVADGLLQAETSALLQDPRFQATVDFWVFAAGDPLAATGGITVLRGWGIEPITISGLLTQSPLAIREAKAATGLPCLTARKLQYGDLNERLINAAGGLNANGSPVARDTQILEKNHV